ncbi:MAG: response regulator transcription factor [Bacteroidales bacterium]|jgi:DNA-binding response OmpR family regulator|nr:response regulator transcription factor [Bacteroidales bacterium]
MEQNTILLVDDDLDLCEVVKKYLEKNGLVVHTVYNGSEAYDSIHEIHPDLIILDIEMPEINGFQLAKMLQKENCNVPVMFISGRHDTTSAVEAFDLGAEDYIRKPVEPVELLARIKCRLKKNVVQNNSIYSIGSYTFNSLTLELSDHQLNVVVLTSLQGKILHFLYQNICKTVTRDEIFEFAWGQKNNDSRAVDMHISNLRKSLSKDKNIEIRNDYALGYSLVIRQSDTLKVK